MFKLTHNERWKFDTTTKFPLAKKQQQTNQDCHVLLMRFKYRKTGTFIFYWWEHKKDITLMRINVAISSKTVYSFTLQFHI